MEITVPATDVEIDAQTIFEEFQIEPIVSLTKAGSGANSKVFRVQTETRNLALKCFPVRKGDQRDRIRTEWDALTFMRECGINSIPEPVARSTRHNAMLLGWIDGEAIKDHSRKDLDTALDFIADIFRISNQAEPGQFNQASGSCLSAAEIVVQINERLEALTDIPELNRFLSETYLPVFEQICEDNAKDIQDATDLPVSLQRLIPADFGFHNTLKNKSGALGFIDFDYFGWDDPVKMAMDFSIHPAHSFSPEEKRHIAVKLSKALPDDDDFDTRLMRRAPLYSLRWAIILLNPFRRDRVESGSLQNAEFLSLLSSQIGKAEHYCNQARETFG